MTGPRVDPANPTPGVLTGAQWSAAQSAPASALMSEDPTKATTDGLGRVLNGDEWSKSQRMTADQVKQWKIPAMPVAPSDATRRLNPNSGAADRDLGEQAGAFLRDTNIGKSKTLAGFLTRQIVAPIAEHPFMTAGTIVAAEGAAAISPLLGLAAGTAFLGEAVSTGAQYGYQKALEHAASPDARKLMEADPDRISGEFAAGQAVMLGLAPLIHVGVKAGLRAGDVSAGMMEAGVRGVKETNFAPRFSEGFADATANARFAGALERGADARVGVELQVPNGFQPTATETGRARAKPAEGLIVPEAAKPGRVKPIETEPASAPLQEAADLNAAAREYQARRVGEDTQDIAAARLADAERLLGLREDEPSMAPRRRPGGAPAPYFETPQGAEVLGMTAARHGLPDDANPYHPGSPLKSEWDAGHQAATESYPLHPEGFSMGGALTDNRIPGAAEIPKTARGSNPVAGFEPTVPEGATSENAALAAALKPSRFRGHATDELVQIARSARESIDHAQSVIDSEGVEPPTVTQAERTVTRANGTLAQVEREFAMRGVTGDALARRLNPDPDGATAGVAPVEGTGPTRTRGLSAGVEQKAIANHLELTVGDLPAYRTVSMVDQAEKATALLSSDPEYALRVAKGQENAPRDLLPESVFIAVENRAIASGDVNTLLQLRSSKLASEITTAAQRLRVLRERNPESPVRTMEDIDNVRSGGAANAEKAARATSDEVKAINERIGGVKVTRTSFMEFVESLKC